MALLLKEADVKSLLNMADTLRVVEGALRAHGEGRARNIARQRLKMPRGMMHLLPAADLDQKVVGLKIYTTFRGGARFMLVLFSAEDGRLLALMEADFLGMMRTGAASGVATRYMAREDADQLALFGSGWQARGQLLAIAQVRRLREVRVFSRTPEKRHTFAEEMAALTGLKVVASATPEEALEGASIITTITNAREPVFPASAVAPGAHVNAAGSNSLLRREIEEELVRKAGTLVVDSRSLARTEGGDLLSAVEKGLLDWDELPELREVLAGRVPGRKSPEEITLFESHGLGLEDVAVGGHLYRLARERGVGEEVSLLDF